MLLEAFMGASALEVANSRYPDASVRRSVLKKIAASFSQTAFAFDRNAGLADIHVAEYASLAAADRAAGTYDASIAKLLSFVKATADALRTRLLRPLTDKETQTITDIVGRMNLVLELTAQNFPGGIPAATASEVDTYMREINDLSSQLVAKRASNATKAQIQYAAEIKREQTAVPPSYEPPPVVSSSSGTVDTSIPGGGAAGSAGQVIETSGTPQIQQTTAQKYGPVMALVAGGIVAYFALR